MGFRVFDTEKKKWIKENVYMNLDGELFLIKQSLFGMTKVPLDANRYINHNAIDLYDKNQNQVYEGDYVKARVADDRTVIGMVVFAYELSSYIILCTDLGEFFTLGSDISSEIEVIGNVFDGY